MFQILIESVPESRGHQRGWGTVLALLVHGAVVGVLLRSPVSARPLPPMAIPGLVFPPDRLRAPAPGPSHGANFHIVETPPLRLPHVVLPQLPDGPATTGGPVTPQSSAMTGFLGGDPGGLVAASLVQEAPVLLSAPPPVYPPALRDAGIEGTVVLRLVVDTLGRVEPGTIFVVRRDHPGLVGSAARSLRLARFRPARMYGRAVRVLVDVPVRFRLRR